MGASASSLPLAHIKLTEKECKTGLRELFVKQVFDAYADSDNMVSLDALLKAYNEKTDVFLTHDWGKELGMDNHERVARVNEAMKKRGLKTWFDSEKMEGNVKKKMISGIENAFCIVAFITQRYMEKVDSDNAEDNCQLEFNYASRRKTARKMVPVVMEARMRSTADWIGEVGMVLGGSLYVDLSTDDSFDARMDELFGRILGVTGVALQQVLESQYWQDLIQEKAQSAAAITNSNITAATAVSDAGSTSSPPPGHKTAGGAMSAKDTAIAQDLEVWISANTSIVPKFAQKYSVMLVEAGIGSIDKLKKKLVRKPAYLLDLDFDEDDADEICNAMLHKKHESSAPAHQPERDFKDLFDLYVSSRILNKPGREELEQLSENSSDIEKGMLATAFLANANQLGGGKFCADPNAAAPYGRKAFEWLKQHAAPLTDETVAPSDLDQKPYSIAVLGSTLLANFYLYGIGVPKDEVQGFKHCKSVLAHGCPLTHVLYGVCRNQAKGCSVDNAAATQSFRIAAATGYPVAVSNLGIMYRDGAGVGEDKREALRLFKIAAEQGYSSAMYNVGWAYYYGDGISVDYEEAGRWFLSAYKQGNELAAYLLGHMTVHGTGVTKNVARGKEMLSFAASKGHKASQDLLNSL
ncbi:toll/interleukin-1 receptor domain-containing protein [archaeon]|nr:MAG: toll/interleukin-1 receptor domain-containing protein [archaeon]